MSRGPPASRLCFLSDLPSVENGQKVRFLGCVLSYVIATGCLELGHLHPSGSQVTASVDIRLVLELINPELTRVGEWVNILGYKTPSQQSGSAEKARASVDETVVQVQALRVWPTGPLDIIRYERECAASKP